MGERNSKYASRINISLPNQDILLPGVSDGEHTYSGSQVVSLPKLGCEYSPYLLSEKVMPFSVTVRVHTHAFGLQNCLIPVAAKNGRIRPTDVEKNIAMT